MNIADIIISSRQREEMENDEYPIHDLASSIRRTGGLIHPIVIDEQRNLIAGGRRHAALTLLHLCHPEENWQETKVTTRANVTEDERFTMELEENLHRKALTPKEFHKALLEFHSRQAKNNPENMIGSPDPSKPRWTKADTAKALGISRTTVYDELRIAEVLSLMPEETKTEIYKKAGDNLELVTREVTQRITRGEKKVEAEKKLAAEEAEAKKNPDKKSREEVVLCTALEGLSKLAENSVDLIVTDPPYGVLENSAGEKGLGDTVYSDREFTDNEDEVWKLLVAIIPELYRVLKPNSHLYLFCGVSHKHKVAFHTIAPLLEKAGFNVRGQPIVWAKPDQGFKPPFTVWPMNAERIIFCTTGNRDREGPPPRSDVITVKPISGGKKKHRFEKPEELIRQLIIPSLEPDGNFLDPFCGGGTHLLAARKLWMRVQGFDSDPISVANSKTLLGEWDAEVLESNGLEQGMRLLEKVKRW